MPTASGVMNKGQLVEVGSTEEVMAHPKDEYTRILLDSVMKVVYMIQLENICKQYTNHNHTVRAV